VRGASKRGDPDRHVQEEDVLPADVPGEETAGDQADRRPRGPDAAPQPKRLVALGAFGEHVHHDRKRRRQDNGGTEALQSAHRDQEAVACGQPGAQRCSREDSQAEHEDPSPPEQIGGATPEQQEAAEGQPVGGHDPLQVRLGEVQVASDGRQSDVHDREIDDRHEVRNSQHGERAPAVNLGSLCIHHYLLHISGDAGESIRRAWR
jgi:hypothetical protein